MPLYISTPEISLFLTFSLQCISQSSASYSSFTSSSILPSSSSTLFSNDFSPLYLTSPHSPLPLLLTPILITLLSSLSSGFLHLSSPTSLPDLLSCFHSHSFLRLSFTSSLLVSLLGSIFLCFPSCHSPSECLTVLSIHPHWSLLFCPSSPLSCKTHLRQRHDHTEELEMTTESCTQCCAVNPSLTSYCI